MDYGDKSLERVDTLREALDSFNEAFEEIKIPITSIPMILYSGYRMKKINKSIYLNTG